MCRYECSIRMRCTRSRSCVPFLPFAEPLPEAEICKPDPGALDRQSATILSFSNQENCLKGAKIKCASISLVPMKSGWPSLGGEPRGDSAYGSLALEPKMDK